MDSLRPQTLSPPLMTVEIKEEFQDQEEDTSEDNKVFCRAVNQSVSPIGGDNNDDEPASDSQPVRACPRGDLQDNHQDETTNAEISKLKEELDDAKRTIDQLQERVQTGDDEIECLELQLRERDNTISNLNREVFGITLQKAQMDDTNRHLDKSLIEKTQQLHAEKISVKNAYSLLETVNEDHSRKINALTVKMEVIQTEKTAIREDRDQAVLAKEKLKKDLLKASAIIKDRENEIQRLQQQIAKLADDPEEEFQAEFDDDLNDDAMDDADDEADDDEKPPVLYRQVPMLQNPLPQKARKFSSGSHGRKTRASGGDGQSSTPNRHHPYSLRSSLKPTKNAKGTETEKRKTRSSHGGRQHRVSYSKKITQGGLFHACQCEKLFNSKSELHSHLRQLNKQK